MKKLFQPKLIINWVSFIFPATAASIAHAYEGMAHPWQMGLQHPVTPVMEQLYDLHSALLILITVISLFVLGILIYIFLRFNRKANPVPSKTTHNTMLEIAWTTIPIIILVVIAIPSLRLHYFMQRTVDADMTVKVLGYQWYWHYEYPDNGGFGFDSYIKKGKDLQPGDHRQLSVDNPLVVPVNTKIRVLVTGADVIHSWAVPAFGVKKDAVPGRLNETWFEATQIGMFYGQCSQLCGVGHGFMPINVDVVSKEDFAAWVAKKKQEAGAATATDAGKDAKAAPDAAKAPAKAPEKTPEKAKDKAEKPAAKAAKKPKKADDSDD